MSQGIMHLFPGQLAGSGSAHGGNHRGAAKKEKTGPARKTTKINIWRIFKKRFLISSHCFLF
jgi:hypothetical protein